MSLTNEDKRAVLALSRSRGWEVVRRWLEDRARARRDTAISVLARGEFFEAMAAAAEATAFAAVLLHVEGLAKEAERDGEEG